MIKKLILISLITIISSCSSIIGEEREKTIKSTAASSRINNSESNSQDIFKELE